MALNPIGLKVDNATSERASFSTSSLPTPFFVVRSHYLLGILVELMAPEATPGSDGRGQRRRNAHERAQQWMTKGGLVREDSDDELGDEDLPWEWIYEEDHDDTNAEEEHENRPSRRRSSRPGAKKRPTIIGARMGTFDCRLGQVVLLKSPEPGKDWVGIITQFLEEEDEDNEEEMVKSAKIMWFASPDEFMSTKNKRRADALPNEQYLTADFNVNSLASINGKATVMSKDAFYARYPNGAPPKGKDALAEYNKCIICRRGVNQLQGRYTDEFIWEDVYREDRVFDLIDKIKDGLKAAKKRKTVDDDVSQLSISSHQNILILTMRFISTLIRKKKTTMISHHLLQKRDKRQQ